MQPVQLGTTSPINQEGTSPTPDSVSIAIEKCDKPKITELVKRLTPLTVGDFAALCLDFPEIAILAIENYKPSELPNKLPTRTLTTLGFNTAHEELLIKLIEANMCEECHTLLHIACQNDYFKVVQLLLGRGADVLGTDDLGNTPRQYAEKFGHANIIKQLTDAEFALKAKTAPCNNLNQSIL